MKKLEYVKHCWTHLPWHLRLRVYLRVRVWRHRRWIDQGVRVGVTALCSAAMFHLLDPFSVRLGLLCAMLTACYMFILDPVHICGKKATRR